MVTLFSSSAMDAELEANNIHVWLEASGIFPWSWAASVIPSFEFQVLVPRRRSGEAERMVEKARAAGPEAAAEAESGFRRGAG